jgi:sensor histidine kinase regulating citrate/malate metabolism
MDIIKSKYNGDWNVREGKLFIGETQVNNNLEVLDAFKEKTGSLATIYLGNEKVATTVADKDGTRTIGTKVSNEVEESVLEKGIAYERVEKVLDKKYSVKYVPIKNQEGKVLGIWSVAIPKSYADNQGNKMLEMRASIVVISILCGILGCLLLMLYSKRYLNDINTLKVSYMGSDSNSSKTQKKVLMMSLFLIGTFIVIWVPIQGFTIGNVVNKLVDDNIKDRLNTCSKLGYMLIDEQYKGDWSIDYNSLYKGTNSLNDNSKIVEKISSNTEILSSIYMGDTRISTNILKAGGTKAIGTKASNEVIETVLNRGSEFTGETTILDKTCISKYTPLKDSSGKAIGMLYVGVDKKFVADQVFALRKPISQVSVLGMIVAFLTFLFLSRRMVSDVNNFEVKLSA